MAFTCWNCFQDKETNGKCPFCGFEPDLGRRKYPLALPEGTILGGRYIIGRVLGEGGFGITYVAQEYATKRLVAIKEYLPGEMATRTGTLEVTAYSEQRQGDYAYGKERFVEEARTLAEFQTEENIVNIYSFFEENNTAYFAMEYVDGINLQQYMREHGGLLTPDEAGQLLRPVMEAVGKIHRKGIVHRDISPDNILITEDGTAKLIDFGAARYSIGQKSMSLDVVLKHGFAPIEQYSRRGKQGPFTDVYAMAATYYYAITGKLPPDTIDRMTDDQLQLPHELGIRIKKTQENALKKGLAVKAEDRFQSMHEFADALCPENREKVTQRKELLINNNNREIAKNEQTSTKERPLKKEQLLKNESPQKKKAFVVMAIAIALVLVVAILGAKAIQPSLQSVKVDEPEMSSDNNVKVDKSETSSKETPSAEQTVLKLWCTATEFDSNRPAYLQAIADYEAAHPKVKIEMEAFENESYKSKIKAAMRGGDSEDLPDIFFTWSGAFLGDFVDAGKVVCLDEIYKGYADKIPEVMLANTTYNGGHYGVPTTFEIVAMFANMDLLAQVGWDHIPETYEDLIACCDALKAQGIIPFGCAGKETWCVTEYLEPIIIKTIGYEDLGKIFAGKATWNDPDIAKAVSTFQDMINKEYFDPAGIALGNDEVKANFLAGKTAFYQNGSWNTGEINDADFTSAVALFPVMNADRSSYNQTIGGPSDSLAVCATSKNADLAAEVAVELGKEICHYNYLNAVGLPAWIPDYDTSSLKPLLVDIADLVASCEGMVLFGDTTMSADPANTYLTYVAQVYGCEIDGEGFVAGLTNDLG